jgi:hypothetical protein
MNPQSCDGYVEFFLKTFRGQLPFAAEHDLLFVGGTISAMERFDWFKSQTEASKAAFAENLLEAVRTLRASRLSETVN